MREAARFWGLTPMDLRKRPRHEQVEMIAHRREYNLRKAHLEDASKVVAENSAKRKKDAEAAKGGRRQPGR